MTDADAQYAKEIRYNVDNMPFVVAKPNQFGNVCPTDGAARAKINQAQIGSCAQSQYHCSKLTPVLKAYLS